MSSLTADQYAQAYVARQSSLAWRRRALRFALRTLMYTIGNTRVHGVENVPHEGAAILMMNHITALDPGVVIGAVTHRIVIPMTKAEAAKDWFMGPFVWWYGAFTVNRGEVDRRALAVSMALLRSGEVVLIAPEGTRTPSGLIEPKEGLVYVATKTNALIVPVAVSDAVDWKARLKRLRRANVTITFGKPFRFKTDGRTRIPREEMAQMTRESMYQLALTLPDPALRGAYSDVENATTETLVFE